MGKFKDLGIPRYQLMEELAELSTECTEIIKLLAKKERFEAKFDETRIGKKETRLREITEKMNSLFEEMIDVKYSYKRFLDEIIVLNKNEHITEIPLYIRKNNTSHEKGIEMLEVPVGTKLTFNKYGDECQTYSSDPVYANCYSGETDEFSFDRKWLFKDPNDMWSFYDIK